MDYKNKVATLRGFYQESKLRYNQAGEPLQSYTAGPWTLFGKLLIKKFRLKNDKAQIEAQRLLILFDDGKMRLMTTHRAVRIEIAFPASATEFSLQLALRKVFLPVEENLSKSVPEMWQSFLLQTENQEADLLNAEDNAKGCALPPGVYPIVEGEASPPVCISCPGPRYEPVAKKYQIEGSIVFAAIISEDGNVRDLRIRKALGAGLEERAAEAIQRWKFKPAQRAGKPVAVKLMVEVHFGIGKSR